MVMKGWVLVGVLLVRAGVGVVATLKEGVTMTYEAAGEGKCGDDLKTYLAFSVAFCAIWCSQAEKCKGFSHKEESASPPSTFQPGPCHIHENLTPPDGTTGYVCYKSLNPAPAPTATTAPAPSPNNGPMSAGDLSDVSMVDIMNNNGKCNSNFGAVGMVRTSTDGLSLLCKNLGNNLPFQQKTPATACSTPAAQQKCMTDLCGANLYYGFELFNSVPYGPCGVFESSQTEVNTGNCHQVTTTQTAPPSLSLDPSGWKEWKACGGGSVFAMTGADVSDAKAINSITCCEVKTI